MSRHLKRTLFAVMVVAALGAAGAAWAFFTTGGVGQASATTGSLAAPTDPAGSPSGSTVIVTWSGVSAPGGGPVDGYYVQRFAGSNPDAACGSAPSSLLPPAPTSCSDTGVIDGTYTYKVTAVFKSWTATSLASSAVVVAGDVTAPTVVSIERADADPTNDATVDWTVTFSEAVTGVGTDDFALTTTGVSGASVTGLSGSGSSRTVTASTGSGDGSVRLDVVDDDSITDASGNPLDGGFVTGEAYTIDKTAAVVAEVSSSAADGTYTSGSDIPVVVTFSEPVTVTGTPTLDLNVGASAVYSGGSGSSTLTFDYTVAAGQNTADLNYVATTSLALNGGTIGDGATNAATLTLPPTGGAGSLGTNKNIVIDTAAPTVTNVTSSAANGSYKAGAVIPVTVSFSEAVQVTGTPTLALNVGASAAYSGGSGSSTLTFDYTVAAGQNIADLNYVATTSLALNGGTIGDGATNAATLTLPPTGGAGSLGTNKNIVVDTTAATVINVTSSAANGSYKAGAVIPVTVSFREAVQVTGTPTLDLNVGASAVYSGGSGSSTLTFGYTVVAGQNTADLNYASTDALALDGGTITDAAANAATLTLPPTGGAGSLGTNKNIVVDTAAPTVTNVTSSAADGSYKAGAVIPVTVSLSEAVIVTGTPQLALATGSPASTQVNYTGGSGTNALTFTYTVAAGNTSPDLAYAAATSLALNGGTIKDAAANEAVATLPEPAAAGSLDANKDIVVDTTAPTIVSIATAGTNPTNAGPLTWTVTFSEPVTGVANGNFALATSNTGGTAPVVSSTTATGGSPSATWTVTATTTNTTGTNAGSIRLNLANTTNIRDVATNNLTATTPVVGQAYTYDTTAPTVTNVTSAVANGTYGVGSVIPVTVAFSEPVHVTGTPQLTLSTGSPSTTAVNYSSGSGTTTLAFTYTVAAGNTSADLAYPATTSLALDGGTIKDAVTNNAVLTLPNPGNAGSLNANKSIVVDGVVPTVTNVTSTTANGSYTAGTVIPVQVTFSKTVTVTTSTGTPTLGLSTGSPASTAVAYASGTGTNTLTFTYTVAAGNTSADLNYAATTSLVLNGGTIRDAAGNDANLTLPATGGAGSLGTNKNIVVDTTAPNQPTAPDMTAASDAGGSNTDDITNDPTPDFAGTAEANSTIQVFTGPTLVGSGTTNASGAYTATVTSALSSGSHSITVKAVDAAGNGSVASSPLSITIDTAAPTGGSVSYAGGFNTTGSVAVTFDGGTDAGTGLNASSAVLQRQSATLANSSCGTFGAFSNLVSTPTSPHTDATLVTGNCYRYQYLIADVAGNQATSTSTVRVMVDTTPAKLTLTTSGSRIGTDGSAVYFNTPGTDSFTATVTDPESGPVAAGYPTLSGWTITLATEGRTYTRTTANVSRSSSIATTNGAGITASLPLILHFDNVVPSASDVQTTNGGTAGTVDSGDTVVFTFSDTVNPSTILSGWTGSSTTVSVKFNEGNAADTMTMATAGLNLGSVTLGSDDYVSNNGHEYTLSATMTMATVSGKSVVTLTLTSSSADAGTVSGNTALVWSPSTAVKDYAQNAVPNTAANEATPADRDF